MLHESAALESYALAFEFVSHSKDRINDLSTYYQHPKYEGLKASCYSDDTHRSLSNARLLLNKNISDLFNPLTYIEQYIADYRDDPRKGFSGRYQKFLDSMIGADALTFSRAISRKASSNGAIMGVGVLGYLKNPSDVVMAASAQAVSTHSSETVVYAQAVALMVHYHLYKHTNDMDEFLAKHVTGELPSYHGDFEKCDMSAKGTYIAVRRLLSLPSIVAIVTKAVDLGGDTDSVVNICTQIATLGPWVNNTPKFLLDNVEGGQPEKLIEFDMLLKNYYEQQL